MKPIPATIFFCLALVGALHLQSEFAFVRVLLGLYGLYIILDFIGDMWKVYKEWKQPKKRTVEDNARDYVKNLYANRDEVK